MVVKVALWYELWTSLLDLCWIIFLFSDLITDEMEASNKRNALASLTDDAIVEILRCIPALLVMLQMCLSLLEPHHQVLQQP